MRTLAICNRACVDEGLAISTKHKVHGKPGPVNLIQGKKSEACAQGVGLLRRKVN